MMAAIGIIVLIAVGIIAASGANGPPDVKGKSVKIEIENNSVVFLFFDAGSAYSINLLGTETDPDDAGVMTFDKGTPRYSVAFVTVDSSNPNPEVVVPEGTYTADIWVCNGGDLLNCPEHDLHKLLGETLIVLPSDEE